MLNRYNVTIRYVTPSGKESSYTESTSAESPFLARDLVIYWLNKCEPRRKVGCIVSHSVTLA